MYTVNDKSISEIQIPIVDITALRLGSGSKKVGDLLHKASQEFGFIYIIGHGIPFELIEKTRQVFLEFFQRPDHEKSIITVSKNHRGWLGPNSAVMDEDALPDLKESFVWGCEFESEEIPNDHPLRGINYWPPFLPEMRTYAMDYFAKAQEVAHHLMRGFALGLNLEEHFFLRCTSKPLSRASSVYYPTQIKEVDEERFGVGPHTDFGVLTVLCQDGVGGLQVKNLKGEWIAAPPIEGSLIVNVGDLLSRWTDGAYRSTPHRVINTSNRERLSLVLAFDPDPETLIDSREIFGPNHTPREPAISCGEYLSWRFEKAFAYRRNNL